MNVRVYQLMARSIRPLSPPALVLKREKARPKRLQLFPKFALGHGKGPKQKSASTRKQRGARTQCKTAAIWLQNADVWAKQRVKPQLHKLVAATVTVLELDVGKYWPPKSSVAQGKPQQQQMWKSEVEHIDQTDDSEIEQR